jgi:hypothetical protein
LIILYFAVPSSKYLNYSVIHCFTFFPESSFACKLCCSIHDSPRAYFTVITFLFLTHVGTWFLWRKVSFKSLLNCILSLVILRDVLYIFLHSECYISPENVFDIQSLLFPLTT